VPDFAHRVIDMVSDEDVSVSRLAGVVSKELGIDQAWLDQTDKHAPGLVDVAKKMILG
jgi:hypothetical protein